MMKKISLLLIAVIALMAGLSFLMVVIDKSQKETRNSKTLPITESILFVDKSDADFDTTLMEPMIKHITWFVEENYRREGDQLKIYFIHNQTSSRDLYQSLTFSKISLDSDEEEPELVDRTIRRKRTIQQSFARKRCREALLLPPSIELGSTEGSDIFGLLKVIQNAYDGSKKTLKKVLIFSDMKENQVATRQFHYFKNLPQSNAKAIAMGKEDLEKIKKLFPELASEKPLEEIEVHCIVPRPPLSNDPYIARLSYYWKEVYQGLGATFNMQ